MATYSFMADITKFDATSTKHKSENALVLGDCAQLAYENQDTIRDAMLKTWKFKRCEFFSQGGTQAFVAANSSAIIVSFRGTEATKVKDLLTDAKIIQTEAQIINLSGKVHHGFKRALHAKETEREQDIWGEILQTIRNFQNQNQSVWFCGHSLGAALAILAAAEYVFQDGGQLHGLYTIGAPRVGNSTFAANFDQRLGSITFRYLNNNDAVTQAPLWAPLSRYTHVGNGIYIDTEGNISDSISVFKRIWNRIQGISESLHELTLDGLSDHRSAQYVTLLAKNRNQTTQWS